MKLSITIEAMGGMNWKLWQHFVAEIERMGFVGLYRSDHFTMPFPPNLDSLEAIVSLTYLAGNSISLHFGTLVAPLSFRDPIMLARQAMAIDDLSGGRMILGLGAGWMEREHTMFGYKLGDVRTRLDRLEEGLEVITQLIRREDPVTFSGRYYQLEEAQLMPRPQRATPVMVGGNGPKRTLPLVARYADIWNCQVAPAALFEERSALLDELLKKQGRRPEDVKRTVMLPVLCWRNERELEELAESFRKVFSVWAEMSTEELLGALSHTFAAIVGTPEQVIAQMQAYAKAGAEEMMIQWVIFDSIQGLEILAEDVLPHVTT